MKVDGIMNPDGETERKLNQRLEENHFYLLKKPVQDIFSLAENQKPYFNPKEFEQEELDILPNSQLAPNKNEERKKFYKTDSGIHLLKNPNHFRLKMDSDIYAPEENVDRSSKFYQEKKWDF